jgi:zinc protease
MKLTRIFFFSLFAIFGTQEAMALKIHDLTTPKGIKVWFVEEKTLPIVSLSYAFEGGSANVPVGQEGIATFATELLVEGAGNLNVHDFKEKLEEMGIQMRFSADLDYVTGSLRTTVENRNQAFQLLKSALSNPRLDAKSIEIVRDRLITSIRNAQKDPSYLVSRMAKKTLYKDHPYGRPEEGTLESIKTIKKEDIQAFLNNEFRRDSLKIVVCGNVDIKELPTIIDNIFGDFQAQAAIKKIADVQIAFPGTVYVQEGPFPQSVCTFVQQGLGPKDPNYTTLVLLSDLIGGSPSSVLWEEVREKRGLSYYVGTTVAHNRYSHYFGGSMGSENARMKDAIDVVREQWQKGTQGNFNAQELEHSKEATVKSFEFAFADTLSTTVALLGYMLEGFDPQYVYDREKRIRSVSIEGLNKFAKSFMDPKQLTFFVVGEPKDLKSTKE